MSPSLLLCGRLTMAVLLLAAHGRAQATFADDVVIDPVASKQNPHVTVTAVQFQSYLRLPNTADSDPQKHLQNLLKVRIRDLQDRCALSEEQRDKLLLAARGDIIRTVDRVTQLQTCYLDKSFTLDELAVVRAEIYRCGTVPLTHPFTEGSLFQKVLTKSLSDKQFAQFTEWDRAQRRLEIRAALTTFTHSRVMLSAGNKPDITGLIMRKYPHWRPVSPYFHDITVMMVHELQDEIRPLVNDAQWALVNEYAASAPRVEPRARAMGYWPIESVENTEDR